MLAYTYERQGEFKLTEKPRPRLQGDRDAIVKVTLASICTSDLHIKHGSVPRAVPGITVGHEMVGVVEEVGAQVSSVQPGDRVTINVNAFSAKKAMSTTAKTLRAAGRWAAESMAVRQNMCGYPMPIRG